MSAASVRRIADAGWGRPERSCVPSRSLHEAGVVLSPGN